MLFDTTVAVLLLRRGRDTAEGEGVQRLLRTAEAQIRLGTAVLPAIAVSELLVGEQSDADGRALADMLIPLPTVIFPVEAARAAGRMGSFLRRVGQTVPTPNLVIAATAVWLDLPLLTWDADYDRAVGVARKARSTHTGVALWEGLRLDPASRTF